MAELTLKDESVIQIGESVSKGFSDLVASGKSILINPAGQPLVSKADDISPTDDFIGPRLPETGAVTNDFIGPQLPESSPVMDLLVSIRDGIMSLVDTFTESLTFQKQEESEAERAARISADDPTPKPDEGTGFFTKSFMDGMKERVDSVKKFTAGFFGIFRGLFGKAALFGLLIAFALNLDKFSGKITEVTKPIIEGLKAAFNSLKEDFVPVIEGLIEGVGLAFETIKNILQGLFNWDLSQLGTGIKQLIIDIPIKLVSIIGDAFFSLLDAALNLFGVDSQMVQDIKIAFRTLPEAIENAINNTIEFFTVTIPTYFENLKTSVVNKFNNFIEDVKNFFSNAFDFIVNDIPNAIGNFVSDIFDKIKQTITDIKDALLAPIIAVKDKIGGFFGGVKDFFTGGDDQFEADKMSKNVSGMSDKEKNYYETVNAKKDDINKFSKATGYRFDLQGTRFSFLEGNEMFAFENPRNKEGYMTDGKDFNAKDAIDFINSGASASFKSNLNTGDTGDGETTSNNTVGKQINQGSVEIADRNTGNTNVVTTKGGDSNINTANNTYTNILEDTNTSDNSLRNYLSA
jgi:hypothetical protein